MKLFYSGIFLTLSLILDQVKAVASPGLSMSFDYSDIHTMKDKLSKLILSAANGLPLPNLAFDGGYLNNNTLFVDQNANQFDFYPVESENALVFEIKNITAQLKSASFRYTLLLVPIDGFLNAQMSETNFLVKVAIVKMIKNGKIIPQLNVTQCQFTLNPYKIKLTLGGNLINQIVDVIIPLIQGFFKGSIEQIVKEQVSQGLPKKLNTFIWNSNATLTLGDLAPDTFGKNNPLSQLTFDYQLDDDFKITKERIQIGINATFYNRDTGYVVPNVKQPDAIPMHDPTIPSHLQIFISEYMLESAVRSYFEKQAYTYEILAAEMNEPDTVAPFITDTLEAIFPFVTKQFGKNIPTDVKIGVHKVWGITTFEANKTDINNQTGRIVANMSVTAAAKLRYPDGKNQSIGTAEFHNVLFSTYINQTNQTILSTWLHSCNASDMWLDTTYMGRFRSSAYVINQATRILVKVFNRKFISKIMLNLQDLTFGYCTIQDPFIGYNNGYISLGLTANFSNSTILQSDRHYHQFLSQYHPQAFTKDGEWALGDDYELKKSDEFIIINE